MGYLFLSQTGVLSGLRYSINHQSHRQHALGHHQTTGKRWLMKTRGLEESQVGKGRWRKDQAALGRRVWAVSTAPSISGTDLSPPYEADAFGATEESVLGGGGARGETKAGRGPALVLTGGVRQSPDPCWGGYRGSGRKSGLCAACSRHLSGES